jgi:ketosteroid isomerase-like protein
MAVERVEYHVITRSIADGSVAEDSGKGLHVYRRDPDGRWQLSEDIWNSDRGANPPA